MLTPLALTGRTREHVVPVDGGPAPVLVHADAAPAFSALRAAAARDGFELAIASGFRDFDAQLALWNRKYRGERPLLDAAGQPIAREALSEDDLIGHILNWSALPGASRHHWGSDIDLVDAAVLRTGHRVQLVSAEFEAGGVFEAFGAWLEANAGEHGFFRPYREPLGGVQPEPWHWSYAPVSVPALAAMTPSLLAEALAAAPIEGKTWILGRLPGLFERYVVAVSAPPPRAALA